MQIRDFHLEEVEVTDAYLKNAFMLEKEYLLKLDMDRLLVGFYEIAGKQPKAERYPGGWEDADIAGHTMGHYLTALAQAYAATGEERFLKRLQYLLEGLRECQAESGYLSAFREELFDNLEQEKQAWVPWYTMHKILAGLVRVYQLTELPMARELAVRLGNWVSARVNRWDEKMKARVLATEYGGMNDCLYELYQVTGTLEYLLAAEKFDELPLFRAIHDGTDILDGKHANTTIPKFLGALNRYRVLGEKERFYLEAAERFFDIVTQHHTYVTGGNSEWEHFGTPGVLAAERTNCNCETCNTYNMCKLARGLFEVTGERKYLDFYEGTYWNAIVSSQNPKTGMTMYFQPMATGYFKVFSRPFDNFWCCTGTGMENFTKLGDSVYYCGEDTLYVAMYLSSVLKDREHGITLRMEADLPANPVVRLSAEKTTEGITALALRVPAWSKGGIRLKKDGLEIIAAQEEEFLTVSLEQGCVELELEFEPVTAIHPLPDNPNVVAFTYGPLVLSAGLGKEQMDTSLTGVNVTVATREVKIKEQIKTLNLGPEEWKKHPEQALVRLGNQLEFTLQGTDEDNHLIFTPHYARYEERYGIYFELVDGHRKEQAKQEPETEQKPEKPETTPESKETQKPETKTAKETSRKGYRGLLVLVVLLGLLTAFCAAMAFSDGFRGNIVATVKAVSLVWSGERENTEPEITAMPSPTAAQQEPTKRQPVDAREMAKKYNRSLSNGYIVSVQERDGKEYLVFDNGVYTVSYRNDPAACEVILSDGTREKGFAWSYLLDAEQPEGFCPVSGEYCGNGRSQLVFSFPGTEGSGLHIVSERTFEEYYVISPEQAFSETVYTDSYLDAGQATIARIIGNEKAYYVALPKTGEAETPLAYEMKQNVRVAYTVGDSGITVESYVCMGDNRYIGKIIGEITYTARDLFQLTGQTFYAFAEDDFCDPDFMGILTPIGEEELKAERIRITGDSGEKLLVSLREEISRNSYDKSNFRTDENGFLAYYENGVKKTLTGVDVSRWQEEIDWKKVAAAGVDYAIIRLGFRGTAAAGNTAIDPYYEKNMRGALDAGLMVGVYYFTQAITVEEAVEEANIVLENIKDYPVTFPIVYDTELSNNARANNISGADRTACAKAFCDTILAAGYTPVIYAGTNWSVMKLNLEELQSYDLWYAYYGEPESLYYPYGYTMWQYTESGTVDGIKGKADLNLSFIDYSTR